MTLSELLGNDYRDGMTVEEITAALATRTLVDQSEVTNLNNQLAARQRLLDKATKDLAAANKKTTDANTQNADLLARVQALEEDKKAADRLASIASYKASLLGQGYDDTLASESAEALADGNNAKFLENLGKFQIAQNQKLKDDLLKGTGAPAAGGSAGSPVDYAKAKQAALDSGNDAEYMRLCREEVEKSSAK